MVAYQKYIHWACNDIIKSLGKNNLKTDVSHMQHPDRIINSGNVSEGLHF